MVCLVGPNGSGKSSLLAALAGIPPATGEVRIGGEDPAGKHPDQRQRLLAFLPASRELNWPVKAADVMALSLPPGGNWQQLVAPLQLERLLERRVDTLSTGERTRVLIARVLAPGARLLLLDEPIANLDPYWQLVALEKLRSAARDEGKAVLVAIHDLRLARQWGDRLMVMDRGRIVADGPPADVERSDVLSQVFGVAWTGGEWRLSPSADRQSSR
jgi:iron complex transport system ATP-binding protein